jgi:GxxExxY protein
MDGSAGDKLLYKEETFRIRRAVFDVHSGMGPGFLEAVYQECLGVEFARQDIAFEALKPLRLTYRGQPLEQIYVADFVCFGRIIVELKAVRALAPEHRAQTINYLRAAGMRVGLLVNFGGPSAEIERFAL